MACATPRPAPPGSLVRVVSPSSPIAREKAERGLSILRSAGYRIEFSPNCFAVDDHLAGTDEQRARDLMEAFEDPEVDLVYCSRGGYGAARLLPHLDIQRMADSGKLFAGFSDVTTLHVALQFCGLATLHAPMAITLSVEREPWVGESLLAALRGDSPIPPEAPAGRCLVPGTAEGDVIGGCLCLLCDTIGTDYPLETEDKILIIEDVDEPPHRVDAMFTHLLNAGILQRCAGIVIGEMTRTDERVDEGIGSRPWRKIVEERIVPLGIPAIIDFPFGHSPQMLSLPLGVRARLDAAFGRLEYLETLCA